MTKNNQYIQDILSGKAYHGKYIKKLCERVNDDLNNPNSPYYFDSKVADRYVDLVEMLSLTEGKWAKKPFILENWQAFIISQIFGWKKKANNLRRFDEVSIHVPKKNGKDLCLTTPIITTEGWKTMGSLEVGDYVFGQDGKPTKVIYLSEIYEGRKCYEVVFNDGSKIVASGTHDWVTNACIAKIGGSNKRIEDKLPPKFKGRVRRKLTTEEIKDTLQTPGGINNHSIEVCDPLEFSEKSYKVEPYLLGVWLGDGDSRGFSITKSIRDYEIIEKIKNLGYNVSNPKSKDRAETWGILGQVDNLRHYGLLGNKHIPEDYFWGSISQRIELMRGLMDTDGTVSKSGQCSFSTIRKNLADDFVRLALSLGLKPSLRERDAKINGRFISKCYEVGFYSYSNFPCFSLHRKLTKLKEHKEGYLPRSKGRQIVAVNEVESVKTKCIGVDNESHLFLAGTSLIPTHNTALAAAIAISYALLEKEDYAGQIYMAATNREQANICFKAVKRTVELTDGMASRFRVMQYAVINNQTQTNIKALSGDAPSVEGFGSSLVIFDEYHLQKTDELKENLITGQVARENSLFISISTAGTDKNAPYYTHIKACKRILDGHSEVDTHLTVIYEADSQDWRDVDVWKQCNPNYGVSVDAAKLMKEFKDALEHPHKQPSFITKHLNIWADSSKTWIDSEKWASGARDINLLSCAGEVAYVGIDLGSTGDFSAVAIVIPNASRDKFKLFMRFYIPEEMAEKRTRADGLRFKQWAREGWITLTPGNATDYNFITNDVISFSKYLQLKPIAYDSALASMFAIQLYNDHNIECKPFGQSVTNVTAPTKQMYEWIINGNIEHEGNPVMAWMISNVEMYQNDANGNYKIHKGNSKNKVDGPCAVVNALGSMMDDFRENPVIKQWVY